MFGLKTFDSTLREASGNIGAHMTHAMARLQQENVGWRLFGETDDADAAIPLNVIKAHSERARRLVSLNPLVKRGLVVRNGYMWTDAIEYKGRKNPDKNVIAANAESVFSVAARTRDEIAFSTDGCVIYLIDRHTRTATNVPVSRLHGVATNEATGEPYALLISPYKYKGSEKDAHWYMLHGKTGTVEDAKHDTDTSLVVVYQTVNRQSGEKFGKPDLMPALYYAQAYKEYLETAHLMSKALARIAYKATSINAKQKQAVTARAGSSGVGGTAVVGMGQDITAVSKAGAGLDFSSGTPLAAMVSAALDIPLSVLLTDGSAGGRQGAETALEDPTFKALELRRSIHAEMISKIASALGITMTMEYGSINNDQVHRRVQSLVLAFQSGALHQIEMRSGVMQVLKVAGGLDVEDLPELPGENETDTGEEMNDSRTGVGPLSDGTNDDRENPTDA